MDNSSRQIKYIEGQIEALKRQRKRIERLLVILRDKHEVLDMWSTQLSSLLEIKNEYGRELISLPENEKRILKQQLGPKALDEIERVIGEMVSRLIEGGRKLTIDELGATLKIIDETIVELMTCVRQMKRGKKEASIKARDIIFKRVGPIGLGIGLIGVDVPEMNWPTILGGGALIFAGIR